MEEIDLKIDDEYGDGFDVMKYIESRYGFFEVIRFISGHSRYFGNPESLKIIEKETGIKILQSAS
jgi:hypothetical protein